MFRRVLLAAGLLAGLAANTHAQPAQPAARHPYEITPQAGPWAICVTCFFENFEVPRDRDFRPGELEALLARSPARKLAIDFVSELRGNKAYLLSAYMFNRGDEERKKEEERVAAQRQQMIELYRSKGLELPEKYYRKRLAHLQDQYMVLVGGYADQDTARRDLERLRKMPPPPERFMSKLIAGVGVGQDARPDGYSAFANPFKTAMVVPNPTGPKIKPPTVDPAELAKGLALMNASNPYNLLKHSGKWTLLVKLYRVPAVFQGREGTGVRQASAVNTDKLYEANAKQAELLAGLLRNPQLNFDSYVLHTPAASMVTVGVFESERDPRLATVQQNLSKLKLQTSGGLTDEQLMSPPLPIQVPRAR